MPALETLHGLRVVADPAALDDARWDGSEPLVLRFAADEAFAIGAEGVRVDDAHAIVVDESGFVGAWLTDDELSLVRSHLEWPLPGEWPALAQGAFAGVPAKLWLTADRTLLLTLAAYRHELEDRLR